MYKNLKAVAIAIALVGCAEAPQQDVTGCYEVTWCVVPEVKLNGERVRGLMQPDYPRMKVYTPTEDPYGCIAHEMRHVAEGYWHDKSVPNEEYCLYR